MRVTILALLLLAATFAQAETLTGRVVRVTDGDTIVVLDDNNTQHKIRLQGIDAPERKQAFGTKSKGYLSDSVAGKFVVVEYDKRDRYGRIVGKVLLSDEDMNLGQVRAGLAWHYKKYQGEQSPIDREQYSEAETVARKAARGLWRDPEPVPPWGFRANTKAVKDVNNPASSLQDKQCGKRWGAAEVAKCPENHKDRNDALGKLARRIISVNGDMGKESRIFTEHVTWACEQWMDTKSEWLEGHPNATEEEKQELEDGNHIFEETAYSAGISWGVCRARADKYGRLTDRFDPYPGE